VFRLKPIKAAGKFFAHMYDIPIDEYPHGEAARKVLILRTERYQFIQTPAIQTLFLVKI
jgi:hypothetical protein